MTDNPLLQEADIRWPELLPPTSVAIMVHGRAGDNRSMAVFARALPREHTVLAFPQGRFADPELGGRIWWPFDAPSPIDAIENAVDDLLGFVGVLRERLSPSVPVIAMGFSQGAGLLSSCLMLRDDAPFSGVALLSGFIPRVIAEQAVAHSPGLSRTSVFVYHGLGDRVVPPERSDRAEQILRQRGFGVDSFREEGVEHKVGLRGMRALREWVSRWSE